MEKQFKIEKKTSCHVREYIQSVLSWIFCTIYLSSFFHIEEKKKEKMNCVRSDKKKKNKLNVTQ